MGDLSFIQQIKNKNQKAIEQWIEQYGEGLMRFAIQYGCSIKEAHQLTVQTFNSLFGDLKEVHTERELVERMYQLVIIKLADSELTGEVKLVFEDDQQLHNKIINLKENPKLVVIMAVFHEISVEEISSILGIPTPVVTELLKESYVALQESQIEKKLAFLHKSYARLKLSVDKEKVFNPLRTKEEKQINEKVPKKTWIPIVIGGLVLAVLLGFTTFNSQEYKNKSAEKYMNQLEEQYEEALASVYKELGLEEASLIETDIGIESVYLGKNVRSKYKRIREEAEKMLKQNGRIDKEKIENQFEKMMTEIETPMKMVENLVANPLKNDFKAGESFIKSYVEKDLVLGEIYYMKLFENEIEVKSVLSAGEDPYAHLNKFGEEYQEVLRAMKKQGIQMKLQKEDDYVELIFNKAHINEELRPALHKDLVGYIVMLDYIYNYEWDEISLDALFEFEKTIRATANEWDNLYHLLTHAYLSMMSEIIKGTDPEALFDQDGKVKKAKRAELKKIAAIEEDSAVIHFIRLIVEEMEESNWRYSETQIFLNTIPVEQILSYAKTGDLNRIQVDEYDLEHSFYGIEPWPNQAFDNLVVDTYERFSKAYDVRLLEDCNPLTIFAIYHYANEQKDPKTMWYLENRVHNDVSLESYSAEWEPVKWSIKTITGLQFEGYNQTIMYGEQDDYYREIAKMVFDEGRWQIALLNKVAN